MIGNGRLAAICLFLTQSGYTAIGVIVFEMPLINKFCTDVQVELSKLTDEVHRLQNMVRAPFICSS